jgi:site-specific recombinase XerD
MKNKMTTSFCLKESKENSKGQIPIFLRVTVNGQRVEISTNKSIAAENWDRSSKRARGNSEEARTINTYLNGLISKADKCFLRLDSIEERITARKIANELSGKGTVHKTLLEAYCQNIEKMKKLEGIEYAHSTIKRHSSALQCLKDYLKDDLRTDDIRLTELNLKFADGFVTYMKTTKDMEHNTVVRNYKCLRRVINTALMNSWIAVDPFRGFTCNFRETYRGYLTQEEIEAIYNKVLDNQKLERVRDCFIFQIYTGLAHADLLELTTDNIRTGIDGGKWITINRKKTGSRSSIPLLERASLIIFRYKDDPACLVRGRLLPVVSNQKMNDYLKELAKACEINKKLTTHLARHTFATTITLSSGVPIETVSKMLGHTDLKTTQIYSKVVDRKVADDMAHLINQKKETPDQKHLEG